MLVFKDLIAEWTGVDVAEFHLARVLGILPEDADFTVKYKYIFWSDNELGNNLYNMLLSLTASHIILMDNETGQVRWNHAEPII